KSDDTTSTSIDKITEKKKPVTNKDSSSSKSKKSKTSSFAAPSNSSNSQLQKKLSQFWTPAQLAAKMAKYESSSSSEEDVFITDPPKEKSIVKNLNAGIDGLSIEDKEGGFPSTGRKTKEKFDELKIESLQLPKFPAIKSKTTSTPFAISIEHVVDICHVWDFLNIFGEDFLKLSDKIPSLDAFVAMFSNTVGHIDLIFGIYSSLISCFQRTNISSIEPTLQDHLRNLFDRQNIEDEKISNFLISSELVDIPPLIHIKILINLVNTCLTTEKFRVFIEQTETHLSELRQAKWGWSNDKKDLQSKILTLEEEVAVLETSIEAFEKEEREKIAEFGNDSDQDKRKRRDSQQQQQIKEIKDSFKKKLIAMTRDLNIKTRLINNFSRELESIGQNEIEYPTRYARMFKRKRANAERFLGHDRNMRAYWWIDLGTQNDAMVGTQNDVMVDKEEQERFGIILENEMTDFKEFNWEYIDSVDLMMQLIESLNTNGFTEGELRSKLMSKMKKFGIGDSTFFTGTSKERQLKQEQAKISVNNSLQGFGKWLLAMNTESLEIKSSEIGKKYYTHMAISVLVAISELAKTIAQSQTGKLAKTAQVFSDLLSISSLPCSSFDETADANITLLYQSASSYATEKNVTTPSLLLERVQAYVNEWCESVVETVNQASMTSGTSYGVIAIKNRQKLLHERGKSLSGFIAWCRDIDTVFRGISNHHKYNIVGSNPSEIQSHSEEKMEIDDIQLPEGTRFTRAQIKSAEDEINGKKRKLPAFQKEIRNFQRSSDEDRSDFEGQQGKRQRPTKKITNKKTLMQRKQRSNSSKQKSSEISDSGNEFIEDDKRKMPKKFSKFDESEEKDNGRPKRKTRQLHNYREKKEIPAKSRKKQQTESENEDDSDDNENNKIDKIKVRQPRKPKQSNARPMLSTSKKQIESKNESEDESNEDEEDEQQEGSQRKIRQSRRLQQTNKKTTRSILKKQLIESENEDNDNDSQEEKVSTQPLQNGRSARSTRSTHVMENDEIDEEQGEFDDIAARESTKSTKSKTSLQKNGKSNDQTSIVIVVEEEKNKENSLVSNNKKL
ncbi:hypothetical protein HK096_003115, partial [Nowakowskiella sp. JEL0078]